MVEAVRKRQQDWEEMRKRMLAGVGKQMVKGGVEVWRENREKRKVEILKWVKINDADEWEQQTRLQPNPTTTTQKAFPDLRTIKPTLLVTIRATVERAGHKLPLTATPLPPGGANQEMDKRAWRGSNAIRRMQQEHDWQRKRQYKDTVWKWCTYSKWCEMSQIICLIVKYSSLNNESSWCLWNLIRVRTWWNKHHLSVFEMFFKYKIFSIWERY